MFTFEMAHALWNYDGKCKNIHGHSYKLFVTLSGTPKNATNDPEDGMILDFGKFKKIINSSIIEKFDHALVVNANSPHSKLYSAENLPFDKLLKLPFQPTTENLLQYFADAIQKVLPDEVKLYRLKLQESDTSYGEWYNTD